MILSLPMRECIVCHEKKALPIHFTPGRPNVCEACHKARIKNYSSSKGPKDSHLAWNAARRGLKHRFRA